MFCWCTVVRYFPVIHILFQKLYSLEKCDRRMGDTKYHNRVWIIASHFADCEVNSIYCDCNVVNHEENAKQFFSQGELNSSKLCFSMLCPNDIHVLFIHYILLPKGVLLILKITSQNTKNISQFLKKNFHLQWTKSLAALGIFIAKWVSNDNSNAAEILFDWNIQKYSLLAKIKSFSFSWNIFSWSWFWRFWWCWQSSAEQSLETVNHMC